MDPNSDSQDIVETTTTENNSAEVEAGLKQNPDDGQHDGGGTATTNTDGGDGEAKPEPEKPKRNRAQERIEQTTRENAELRRKIAEFEAEKALPKNATDKPKIEEFESYDDYEEKLEEWRIGESVRRMEEKQSKSASEEAQVKQQVEYSTAIVELQDEGIDTESLFKKAETLPALPVQLDQFGLSAKETLKLAADLLQNDDLYFEIAGMSAIRAAARIGQMINTPSAKPSAPKIPNAPKPITPTSANSPVKRDAETMSDNEFLKSRGL